MNQPTTKILDLTRPASVMMTFALMFIISFSSGCKKDDPEDKVEICDNNIDDDEDGFVDADDLDCTETGDECTNGLDDDGDSFIDCNDFDCNGHPNC